MIRRRWLASRSSTLLWADECRHRIPGRERDGAAGADALSFFNILCQVRRGVSDTPPVSTPVGSDQFLFHLPGGSTRNTRARSKCRASVKWKTNKNDFLFFAKNFLKKSHEKRKKKY